MKIKDLFKNIERTNDFRKECCEKPIYAETWDGYTPLSFTTYKDFKKWLTKEYRKEYVDVLLEQDFQKCLDGSFYATFQSNDVRHEFEIYIDWRY